MQPNYRWVARLCLMLVAFISFFSTEQHLTRVADAEQVEAVANNPSVNVEWHITKEQATDLNNKYKIEEPNQLETRSPLVVGMVVLVRSFVIPQIIEAFVDLFEKYKNDGFLLDARGDKVVVEKSDRVPPGSVIVITENGVETIKVGGPNPNLNMFREILNWAIKR